MAKVEKSIEVDVPVRVAYNQWTQFEEFPRFMEGVKQVRQLGPKDLQWRAEIGGKEVEWTATILHQEPDRHIAWQSTSGEENAGAVTFEPLGAAKTRVSLRLHYAPEGVAEKAGSALGVVSMRVEGDLKRFKKFIEERGRETGSWRGEIEGGQLKRPAERELGQQGPAGA
jgi:uncharacterized membrane protein